MFFDHDEVKADFVTLTGTAGSRPTGELGYTVQKFRGKGEGEHSLSDSRQVHKPGILMSFMMTLRLICHINRYWSRHTGRRWV